MKVFIAALLILLLLIGGGIAADLYLHTLSEDIANFADRIDQAAQAEDFDTVRAVYQEMQTYWDANEMPLTALVDHAHTVEIDKSLKELEMSMAVEADTEILLSCAKVRMEVKSIANDEHFHIKNIL